MRLGAVGHTASPGPGPPLKNGCRITAIRQRLEAGELPGGYSGLYVPGPQWKLTAGAQLESAVAVVAAAPGVVTWPT